MATKFTSLTAHIIVGLTLACSAPALAVDFTNTAFAPVADSPTSIPVGHLEFCRTRPSECQAYDQVMPAVTLGQDNWQQLVSINARFNQAILPVNDKDLYQIEEFWTYPSNGRGDCEDYALVKRRALIEAGWHPSTLMIAVVRQADGSGHAVLMARTDRGDLVLDNQDGLIRVWNETPYQFLKRQSQTNAGQWVDMFDNRVSVVAATS